MRKLLTPQAPVDEDGFVVVSGDGCTASDSSSSDRSSPPLSRRDIANIVAVSLTQLLRDRDAKAASETTAAIASAVAKVRADLETRIEALQATQDKLATALAKAELRAQEAEEHVADLERELEETKSDCLLHRAGTTETLRKLQNEAASTSERCSDLERRTSPNAAPHGRPQPTPSDLQSFKDESNKRLTSLETRTKWLENSWASPDKRPVVTHYDNGVKLSQGSPDGALRRVEQRLYDELRRKQEKLDSLSTQLKAERSRSDSMFIKVSAMSLVLRGGPLPTEDPKALGRISSWLERFKDKTSDQRLRERANGYITKISERTPVPSPAEPDGR